MISAIQVPVLTLKTVMVTLCVVRFDSKTLRSAHVVHLCVLGGCKCSCSLHSIKRLIFNRDGVFTAR
jgi:hypothetical protein